MEIMFSQHNFLQPSYISALKEVVNFIIIMDMCSVDMKYQVFTSDKIVLYY